MTNPKARDHKALPLAHWLVGGGVIFIALVGGLLSFWRSYQAGKAIDTDFQVPGFEAVASRTDRSATEVTYPDHNVRSFELVVEGSLSEVLPVAERQLNRRGYEKSTSRVKGWTCFDGKHYKKACVFAGNKLDPSNTYNPRFTTIFIAR